MEDVFSIHNEGFTVQTAIFFRVLPLTANSAPVCNTPPSAHNTCPKPTTNDQNALTNKWTVDCMFFFNIISQFIHTKRTFSWAQTSKKQHFPTQLVYFSFYDLKIVLLISDLHNSFEWDINLNILIIKHLIRITWLPRLSINATDFRQFLPIFSVMVCLSTK